MAERRSGKTVFVDPQNGSPDCSDCFKRVKKNGTYCMRVDDRPFTDLMREAVQER